MKLPIPNWRRVACEECGAAVGESCHFPVAVFGIRHYSRAVLADAKFPSMLRGARRGAINPQVHKYRTRHWSDACKRGECEKCSGFRRGKRGEPTRVPCLNPYHLITKVTLPTLQASE